MRYAENNQISHRQLYRQMLLSFLAPFLLCLPGEGSLLGKPGILGILAGALILTVYSFFLQKADALVCRSGKNAGEASGKNSGNFFYGLCDPGSRLSLIINGRNCSLCSCCRDSRRGDRFFRGSCVQHGFT